MNSKSHMSFSKIYDIIRIKVIKMVVINWNISYSSDVNKIISLIKSKIEADEYIVTLQEVTSSAYSELVKEFMDIANIEYSLNYREPGKFDTRSRKLGILIMTNKNIKIEKADVLNRTLLPDRTLFVKAIVGKTELKIISLHSITGCDHKKAKSLQFYSFAEAIDDIKPDIVSFDANEPSTDHYNINQMEYFDNKDKGAGASTFFRTLENNNLQDSYTFNYDKSRFVYGEPLATSHIINKTKEKRYDFVFVNKDKFQVISSDYLLDESLKSSSDHSLISVNLTY